MNFTNSSVSENDLTLTPEFNFFLSLKAGCKVVFDDEKCNVIYDGAVILQGLKDPSTDLWTLPIRTAKMWTENHNNVSPSIIATTKGDDVHPGVNSATFTHSVRTRGNGVKFAHQALCNPKISTLLKAVRHGFLHGCPNMSEKLILKYLNPSPATAKGHMKRPWHGIRTTHRIAPPQQSNSSALPIQAIPILRPNEDHVAQIEIIPAPKYFRQNYPFTAYLFCSTAFADKVSGVVYSDLTGNFPFMSYDGNKCFIVIWCGAHQCGTLGNIPDPHAGPSLSFFCTNSYIRWSRDVTRREPQHHTNRQNRQKHRDHAVGRAALLSSDMELMDQRDRTCGRPVHGVGRGRG